MKHEIFFLILIDNIGHLLLIVNYLSNHPIQHKKNFVYNLVDRALLLSEKMFHNKNLIKVKSLLTKNNYPINFIENNVKRCMSKIKYCSLDNNNNNKNNKPINIYKQTIKVHIPYIIEEIFLKLSQIFQKYNFSSIPKVCKNLNPIVKLGNDTLDKWNQINVVYKFA